MNTEVVSNLLVTDLLVQQTGFVSIGSHWPVAMDASVSGGFVSSELWLYYNIKFQLTGQFNCSVSAYLHEESCTHDFRIGKQQDLIQKSMTELT